jgi:hypothetical protein
MMINLLQETIAVLKKNGKTPEDVKWVGNYKISFSWDDFAKIADFEYDHDYGISEIKESLVVVGNDWWLARREYDGREWWKFLTLPTRGEFGILTKSYLIRDEYKDDDDDWDEEY